MSVSAVKRGRDGKLRYTREGRAYVVRADGARFYFGGGAAERVYCTREVRRFLRDEANMRGGAGDAGPAQDPVAGESAIELLPTDTMRNIMRRIEDPMDLAAFLRTSRYMTPHAGPREWEIVARLPSDEFQKIVRILAERECLALNDALGGIMAANPIGAQYADEDDQERAMDAWIDASNKMEIVNARIAVAAAAAAAVAQA
jgi:hypothetical protein